MQNRISSREILGREQMDESLVLSRRNKLNEEPNKLTYILSNKHFNYNVDDELI